MLLKFGNPNCGVKSVNGINEHTIRNPIKNSVFSRLCNISLITFTKVPNFIEGYVWTIWNCLESVLRLKKIRGIPSKSPCFPENLVTGKYRSKYARTHTWVYLDHFEPFLKFLKKVPRKVPQKIPSFRVFQNPPLDNFSFQYIIQYIQTYVR